MEAGKPFEQVRLSSDEYRQFQRFIFDAAGITLSANKTALVSGRLSRRLRHWGLTSYEAYLRLLESDRVPDERQTAIDLLTTNETYFFREPVHFHALREEAEAARRDAPFRVWSAACASGEEAYSIAMVLADVLGDAPWDVLGTDISMRALERAATGHYQIERAERIPPEYRQRYCLKGTGQQDGTLLVARPVRRRVRFGQVNLNAALPAMAAFDVIFLRNVMIYFSGETKAAVAERVLERLNPGGCLIVGRSESLHGTVDGLEAVMPSVYRKRSAPA
ncbi:MAG TPA: protein-glutamate O-methyltransferase CheR [Burkholderiaceae bacterium]